MKSRRILILLLVLIFLFLMLFPLLWRSSLRRHYQARIYDVKTSPQRKTAVVFGAAVMGNGRLSTVLRDRMNTAIQLYLDGKVEKILVSGHKSDEAYDEPGAMKRYAVSSGVASEDVIADYGGNRTYDTCYRAASIFELDSVILVTQKFHLPRALFTCSRLGISAVGVEADQRPYRAAEWYEMRETVASTVALVDVIRGQKPAVLGAPMPIR